MYLEAIRDIVIVAICFVVYVKMYDWLKEGDESEKEEL